MLVDSESIHSWAPLKLDGDYELVERGVTRDSDVLGCVWEVSKHWLDYAVTNDILI